MSEEQWKAWEKWRDEQRREEESGDGIPFVACDCPPVESVAAMMIHLDETGGL